MILVQVKTLLLILTFSFVCIFTCTLSKPEDFNLSQNSYASFVTGTSLVPQQFLLICRPLRAGRIIQRCMRGLVCITVF